MSIERCYTVFPVGMTFTNLEHAKDAARLDSTTGDFETRVEDSETEEVIARYKHGAEVVS